MSKPIEPPARLSRGFTTLELLGVLMVIAILAAAVAPNVIGLLKSQKIRSEQEAVQATGSALRTGIIRSQRLPLDDTIAAPTDPQADWAELAELGGGGGRQGILRQVVDNDGKLVSARRLFLPDPATAGVEPPSTKSPVTALRPVGCLAGRPVSGSFYSGQVIVFSLCRKRFPMPPSTGFGMNSPPLPPATRCRLS